MCGRRSWSATEREESGRKASGWAGSAASREVESLGISRWNQPRKGVCGAECARAQSSRRGVASAFAEGICCCGGGWLLVAKRRLEATSGGRSPWRLLAGDRSERSSFGAASFLLSARGCCSCFSLLRLFLGIMEESRSGILAENLPSGSSGGQEGPILA